MIDQANQIALQFAGFSHEDAVEGVRDHIRRFWERRMRDQLIDYVAQGGDGLSELVIEAVKRMEISA
jgi:formate dehydrogenase subunit delta